VIGRTPKQTRWGLEPTSKQRASFETMRDLVVRRGGDPADIRIERCGDDRTVGRYLWDQDGANTVSVGWNAATRQQAERERGEIF
jgi:hypothetical protein